MEKDEREAAYWYRKALDNDQHQVDGGSCVAMLNPAEAYAKGDGLERNGQEARRWYQAAASAGNSRGYYKLYLLSRNGEAGNRNEAEALKWLLEYARVGSALAMYTLGGTIREGRRRGEGSEADVRRSFMCPALVDQCPKWRETS